MPKVSVVILNYNVADLLRECLRSVLASEAVSFDVWVVDNRSTDHSAEMVKQEFPQVTLIESPVNGGFAYGNNLAIRRLIDGSVAFSDKPDFILLLNPDTLLVSSVLRDMAEYMDRHPEAGAAGPKLVKKDGSLDLACRRSFPSPEISLYRMLGLSKRFPRSRRFGRYNLTYLDPDLEAEVDSVVGAFMMVRREVVEQVGLLDESFFMYGEDLDWAFRMKQKGWKVLYNPAVTVLHYKGESSRQARAATTSAFYKAMLIFYRKHYQQSTGFFLHWLIVGAIYGRGGLAHVTNLLRPINQKRVI
ncbi:MAG: glycosyltransferase family 2 protein [Dehalococcoidia bacterium]|nr:glycosyltransferase family 2 protein [Dehalococcoidia bacterium]